MASDKSDQQEQTNVLVGMGVGGTAAAVAGAVAGAVVGGPVGAIAGASLGGFAGSLSGGALAYGEVEPEFRHEYESSATSARGTHRWEDISPAYRYGWESHDRPEYQGKAWSQVNTHLEKGWTNGQWSAYEPHVRSAWERRSRHQEPAAVAAPTSPVVTGPRQDDPLFGTGTAEAGTLLIGGGGGAILGGVMGLLVGGPIGAAVGGTLGTLGGALFTQEIGADWHEPVFQAQHEADQGNTRHSWEQAKPAYRYGWESHNQVETQGQIWPEARVELAKGWQGPGSFAEYEQYIKEGWEKRMPATAQPQAPHSA